MREKEKTIKRGDEARIGIGKKKIQEQKDRKAGRDKEEG